MINGNWNYLQVTWSLKSKHHCSQDWDLLFKGFIKQLCKSGKHSWICGQMEYHLEIQLGRPTRESVCVWVVWSCLNCLIFISGPASHSLWSHLFLLYGFQNFTHNRLFISVWIWEMGAVWPHQRRRVYECRLALNLHFHLWQSRYGNKVNKEMNVFSRLG